MSFTNWNLIEKKSRKVLIDKLSEICKTWIYSDILDKIIKKMYPGILVQIQTFERFSNLQKNCSKCSVSITSDIEGPEHHFLKLKLLQIVPITPGDEL